MFKEAKRRNKISDKRREVKLDFKLNNFLAFIVTKENMKCFACLSFIYIIAPHSRRLDKYSFYWLNPSTPVVMIIMTVNVTFNDIFVAQLIQRL